MNKVKACFVFLAGIAALLIVGGCMARTPTRLRVPRNIASVCRSHCEKIGLHMGAVVIISDATGCVCEAASAQRGEMRQSRSRTRAGALVAASGAVVMEEDEAEREE